MAFSACLTVLLASLLLGGGTRGGFLADAVLQLLCIPFLLAAVWSLRSAIFPDPLRWIAAFWAAVFVLLAAQLIALPPIVWSSVAARADVLASFSLTGRPVTWLPLSVSPQATLFGLLSLLPPLAVFAAAIQLNHQQRRTVSLVLLGFGVVSVFLGLVQLSQGQLSPYRFFPFTNTDDSVGFFANRNHFAALLYCLFLLASVWTWEAVQRRPGPQSSGTLAGSAILWIALGAVVMILLLAGQVMTRSRAGLGLTILALIGGGLLATVDRRTTANITPLRFIAGAAAVAVVLSIQYAFYSIIERLKFDPLHDDRVTFATHTIEAAKAFMPFGSGVGSFSSVYVHFQKPQEALLDVYANRAHNDLAELWLETGVAGPALLAVFLVWLVVSAARAWRMGTADGDQIDRSLARCASLAIGLILVHSLVDYPLRTNAMMAVAAFFCALLVRPPETAHAAKAGHASHRPAESEAPPEPKRRIQPERARRRSSIATSPERKEASGPGPQAASFNDPNAMSGTSENAPQERQKTGWQNSSEWPDSWRQPLKPTVLPPKNDKGSGWKK